MKFNTIEDAIDDIKKGKMVIHILEGLLPKAGNRQ